MNDELLYPVPTQLIFKRWQTTNEQPFTRRLLLKNPSQDTTQLFLLLTPATKRFQVDINEQSTYGVPGGEAYQGRCFELPPQATLTCTVIFQPASTAASSLNYQDAIFIFNALCANTPFLTIPLLAIANGDSAAPDSFTPKSIHAPMNPPNQFFMEWQQRHTQMQDEELSRQLLQQQVHPSSSHSKHQPDVFILDEEKHAANDSMHDDSNDSMSPASDDERENEEMKQMEARLSAAARHADVEDAMSDDRPRTPTHPSAPSALARTTLTSAGLYRTGLAARIHTSQGGRAGAPIGGIGGDVPGEIRIYQPFQRPMTAEQRHLTDHLDSGFVVSTESAIDELVNEDYDAAEEEEERRLLQSAQGSRPKTAAPLASSIVPPLQVTPAAMVYDDIAMNISAEQDENDFYQQIIATARGSRPNAPATSAPTPHRKNSGSSSTVDASPTAPRVTRQGSGRRAHPGIPRSTPTASSETTQYQPPANSAPRQSPELVARRTSPSYPSNSTTQLRSEPSHSSRHSSSTPTSSANVTHMMRQLQLTNNNYPPTALEDRLAYEQEIERRKYQTQFQSPESYQRNESTLSSTSTGLKLPKLK